ncbi:MobQ family relaxase, partial [Sphingomonas aurantiaca]|uniref:MobQ family relaxase n=1 Tax=Sphingomonas aurantiaca TaxID=185949 RepID=UPI0033445EBD
AVQIIGRADGRSAIAAAAYRSGDLLIDERTGTPHRHGDADRVAYTEIVAPAGALPWATNRGQLWNRVETGERRKDSQLAREFEIALPNELSLDQQRSLIRGWVAAELTPLGVITDIAIHTDPRKNAARQPDNTETANTRNDHAHLMTTMRGLTDDGDGFGAKLRELNWNGTVPRWRASWAEHANAALERAGVAERIDHRSHVDRNLREEPTKKEGPVAHAIETRGGSSDRMAINRDIRKRNSKLREQLLRIRGRITKRFNLKMISKGIGPSAEESIPLDVQAAWIEQQQRSR